MVKIYQRAWEMTKWNEGHQKTGQTLQVTQLTRATH